MNIQFEPNNSGHKTEQTTKTFAGAPKTTAYQPNTTKSTNGISLDISGFVMDNNAYVGQGKTTEDVMNEIGSTNVETMQDYMTVMSNTLSGEDYQKLMEDGYSVGEMPVAETVTVVDEIKATMAEAGIVIEGYNDHLDKDVLKQIVGNTAYAEAIAASFEKYNVETTEQNLKDAVKELEKMSEVQNLSDNAVKYMLLNELDPTTDNLFKAAFSGGAGALKQSQGYFAQDGYYGKKAETVDTEALKGQIDKIIEQAGLVADDITRQEAGWIIENGIALTADTLSRLHDIRSLQFPMETEEVADAVCRAITDGKRPKEADLSEERTILEQAVDIKKKVDQISDAALQTAIYEEKPLQINVLANQTELAVALQENEQKSYITAKRQLEEIRLHMTVSANYQLLKKGIQIDTLSLEKTVDVLKKQEEAFGKLLFAEQSRPEEAYKLWQETDLKVAQLKMMPAALVGEVAASIKSETFTLNAVHETGSELQSRYEQASQSYETLMTAPRRDLGDSIVKAFRNVDDILNDLGEELTVDNRRAVRILGYNQMEITAQSIEQIKEADNYLREVISSITPQKTLQMIRDGINPLETSMEELREYLAGQEDTNFNKMEKYSKFLYQLEQNNEITREERDAYIGIYRMLRQIEKSDGAAVGTIVHNGQSMSFANLLSAVRTRKTGHVNQSATDETGFLKESVSYKNSISDQINAYFKAFSTQETDESYAREKQAQIAEAMHISGEALEQLLADGQSITPDVLEAQKEFLQNRGSLYKRLGRFDEKNSLSGEYTNLLEQFTDADSAEKAYDNMLASAQEIIENAMDEGEATYIDVRSMVISCKQLSLAAALSKEENYEVPIKLDGEMTSVNIRIMHNRDEKGEVRAAFENEIFGKVNARFVVQTGGWINGFVTVSNSKGLSEMQAKDTELCQNILKESGKKADVNYAWQEKEISVSYKHSKKDETVSTNVLYQIAKGFLQTFAEQTEVEEKRYEG